MFTFVRFMWYDPQEQRKCARVRRTFCNVTMLAQILPKPYAKIQYLSLAMQSLPLHVSRWCRANFGPASSFSCSVFRFDSKSFSSLFFWCFHCKVCSALCGSLLQAASDSTWRIAKLDFLSWDFSLFQVQKRFRVSTWRDAQPAWPIQNWHRCSPSKKMQRVLRPRRSAPNVVLAWGFSVTWCWEPRSGFAQLKSWVWNRKGLWFEAIFIPTWRAASPARRSESFHGSRPNLEISLLLACCWLARAQSLWVKRTIRTGDRL